MKKFVRTLAIATFATLGAAGSALADYSYVTAPANAGAGWWNAPAGADTRSGGTATIAAGPGGPGALGAGSLRITTDSTIAGDSQAKAQFVSYGYVGTKLNEITGLSFQDYRSSASTTNPVQRIGLNVAIDFVGDGSSFATLVFEPIYQSGGAGALLSDTWQTWDALKGGAAIWWSAQNIPGVCAFACYVPWSAIVAANPNAKVKYALGFNMGSGLVGQFTGAADGLVVRTSAGTDVYDFEVAAPAPATTALTVTPSTAPFGSGDGTHGGNHAVGVLGDSAPGFDVGSFASDGLYKTDMYFTPADLFGRDVNVGEVVSISYWTKIGTAHVNPTLGDWFLAIYTKPYANQVGGSFYGTRIGTEPYLAENLVDPANAWNEWVTDAPSNWLRFFESTYGYFGSYSDPHWDKFIGGMSLSGSRGPGVAYATQPVLFFSVQTGAASATGFTGKLDGFTVELSDGSIASVNFEADLNAVKSSVLADLQALLLTLQKPASDKVKSAIEHLQKSLNPKYWVDGLHLTKDGKPVFDEEKRAVHSLEEVVPRSLVLSAINSLVADDRALATIAISESTKSANDIAKANNEIAKGDADRANGKYEEAIGHYKNAWDLAT